jgi:hypothetical protein
MPDYFEMERVIEELAKSYPAKCETTVQDKKITILPRKNTVIKQ